MSPRVDWLRSVGDLANFYSQVMVEQGWVGADVIGFSFGGWIAAEMAAQNPGQFASLTLVAPFGIKPPAGMIRDLFEAPTVEGLAERVEAGDLPVEAIALEVGYQDASFFGRLFRRKVALTPAQYRRRFQPLARRLREAQAAPR